MDPRAQIEELKRLRDDIRRRLQLGEGDETELRVRLVQLAQAITDLETG